MKINLHEKKIQLDMGTGTKEDGKDQELMQSSPTPEQVKNFFF